MEGTCRDSSGVLPGIVQNNVNVVSIPYGFRTDSEGYHVTGGGHYGFCDGQCPPPDDVEKCVVVSGPGQGSHCVFPFIFAGTTYTSCAEWAYGGDYEGQYWCSTKYYRCFTISILISSVIGLTVMGIMSILEDTMDSVMAPVLHWISVSL